MSHYHVTRYAGDDDPYVCEDIYQALDYAAGELDRLHDSMTEYISDIAERVFSEEITDIETMRDALREYRDAERVLGAQLNAANIARQHQSERDERAPLYAEDTVPDDSPDSLLLKATVHVTEIVNDTTPMAIWECPLADGTDDDGSLFCRGH